MSNLKKAITGFFFATVFLVFMGIHISADMSEISFTGESVCAQTGTCEWSVMDNCYVNGEKDPYRKWVSGETEEPGEPGESENP